jgi:hypothetical protein
MKEKSIKLIKQALSKSRRFDNKQFVAYLRPDEMMSLINDGAQSEFPPKSYIEFQLKTGNCKPSWFYFIPGKTAPEKDDDRNFTTN